MKKRLKALVSFLFLLRFLLTEQYLYDVVTNMLGPHCIEQQQQLPANSELNPKPTLAAAFAAATTSGSSNAETQHMDATKEPVVRFLYQVNMV